MSRLRRLVLTSTFAFAALFLAPGARPAHAAPGNVNGYACGAQWLRSSGRGNEGYLRVVVMTEPYCQGFITKSVLFLGSGQTYDTAVPGFSTTILANWYTNIITASAYGQYLSINGNFNSASTQLRASDLAITLTP
jgi:hypothetical protein